MDISERPKNFGACQYHQDSQRELYCKDCKISLCVYCKISGNHSSGDNHGHQLIRISEAYEEAIRNSKDFDPHLEKTKSQLGESLKAIDANIKDLEKNASK